MGAIKKIILLLILVGIGAAAYFLINSYLPKQATPVFENFYMKHADIDNYIGFKTPEDIFTLATVTKEQAIVFNLTKDSSGYFLTTKINDVVYAINDYSYTAKLDIKTDKSTKFDLTTDRRTPVTPDNMFTEIINIGVSGSNTRFLARCGGCDHDITFADMEPGDTFLWAKYTLVKV
jgi:hypothetical protein